MSANEDPRPATIAEVPSKENGYFYKVVTVYGEKIYMRGLGAPKGGKIGDRGFVTYKSTPSYGLDFWEKEKAP